MLSTLKRGLGDKKTGSMFVSGKLPTYPSPNLTFTLTSCFGQNVRFGEGYVDSFPETYIDPVNHLLLSKDPSTIRLSSKSEIISVVSPPFRSNSPRFLNPAKLNTCDFHSATTWLSLASMSFSFTAEMQMSWNVCDIQLVNKSFIEGLKGARWKPEVIYFFTGKMGLGSLGVVFTHNKMGMRLDWKLDWEMGFINLFCRTLLIQYESIISLVKVFTSNLSQVSPKVSGISPQYWIKFNLV